MKPQHRIGADVRQLQLLLKRLKDRKLEEQDYELLESMLETWKYLCSSLEKKNLSIKRLQRSADLLNL